MQIFSDRYRKSIKFKRSIDNMSFYSSDYTKKIDEDFNEIVKGKDSDGNEYSATGTVSRLNIERISKILNIKSIKPI